MSFFESLQGSSDLGYVDQVVGIVNRSGVIGVLIIIILAVIVGLNRGWFYTSRYVTMREAAWQQRVDDMRVNLNTITAERDSWKMLAMSRRNTAQRALTLAEMELIGKESKS